MTCSARFSGILGFLVAGKERAVIVSSLCLIIIAFFYFFVAGSAVQTNVFTFQNRVSYERPFSSHIVSVEVDFIILLSVTAAWFGLTIKSSLNKIVIVTFFLSVLTLYFLNLKTVALVGSLVTLPLAALLVVADRQLDKKLISYSAELTLKYLNIAIIILVCLGLVTLFELILIGYAPFKADEYSYALYQQLSSLVAPIIIAALAFCLPLKIILNQFTRIIKVKRERLIVNITQEKFSTKRIASYLILCILLGVTVAIIPHLSTVNPNEERVGVDTPSYVYWLHLMNNKTADPVHIALTEVASGDRPLTMLVLFTITKFIDPFILLENSPLVFIPVLIVVTFFLTRQLTSNDKISVLAAFLSAISFQTLIGMYSGFYANWLALILGYLAFIFLLRCIKQFSKFNVAMVTLLTTSVLLAHVYTWSIIISIAFVFVAVLYIIGYCTRKRFLILCIVLSVSIAIDVLNSLLLGSSSGIEADVSVGLGHGFGITRFSERFGTLVDTVMTYYGGVYANIAILALVLYWLIRCQVREIASIFLLIFMSTSLIPLFLGDWVLQSRVLYDIPFQIPAAISLYMIWKGNRKLVFFAMILIATYLSFHVVGNIGYIPSAI